ncbi:MULTISPECIES: hypothetical protein [Methanothermobacter]|uniref:Uncharacterized protein n=1 Tax=Methanothermobacter wolfeii TaxID=145261 RepID=A0A9E7RT10_METWO|nr:MULTISPECIES: hypothetical protein [Methanothermobacter]UXH31689.1 hypothetical protein N5910_09195 [Methanothermobacter wolfeii]
MLFSTDFLLSLIIVTIILGFSAGLIDAEESRLAESFREDHVKKRAADGVEVLINSPGDPPGWENLPAAMCRSPGLAVPGRPGVISYRKFMKLSSNPEIIGRALPGLRVSFTLKPLNCSIRAIEAGAAPGGGDTVVVRRTLKCDFLSDYAVRTGTGICPHQHNDTWKCVNFRVNSSSDYYLISEVDDGSFIVDTADNMSSSEIKLVSKAVKLNLTEGSVVWLHVKGHGRFIIIAVPTGSRDCMLPLDYFEVHPCVLEVRASNVLT